MQKKVYISSTYKDLIAYRDAIREMFLYKGMQDEYVLVSMEGYVSESGKRSIEVCLEDVRQADIYVLILAKRYGSIVEGTGISYTETEFNEALKMATKNPFYKIFIFYSSEEIEKADFASVKNLESPELEKFYQNASNNSARFISPFTTPDNLCKQILLTFNFNFKKPDNLDDCSRALRLIDRNAESYSFSRSFRKNTNAFYFTSVYDNSPHDFLERLYDFEIKGNYRKCRLELSKFNTTGFEKFKQIFIDELFSQWNIASDGYENGGELFLSFEINSLQINDSTKLKYLQQTLDDFLPGYLIKDGKSTGSRLFFIFYTYLPNESSTSEKFDTFMNAVVDGINLPGCTFEINPLPDVTRQDVRNWLDVFIQSREIDDDTLDTLLNIDSNNPFRTFKMREVNRYIRTWMSKNLFNN